MEQQINHIQLRTVPSRTQRRSGEPVSQLDRLCCSILDCEIGRRRKGKGTCQMSTVQEVGSAEKYWNCYIRVYSPLVYCRIPNLAPIHPGLWWYAVRLNTRAKPGHGPFGEASTQVISDNASHPPGEMSLQI